MDLYVQETGPLDAPTIVLLHGGGVSGWSWQPEVDRLAAYHVLVPDLPAHGRSPGPFSMARAAGQVAELIRRRAHGGRAHVCGLSLGAQVLVQLLASDPEPVLSAFVSAALLRRIPGASLVRPTLWAYMPFRNIPWLVRANMRQLAVPETYYPQFAEETRRMTLDAMTQVFTANMTFGRPAGLDGVRCPVLAICGSRELGQMKASVRELAAAIPGARPMQAQGQPHNWPLTAPDLFTASLVAFITGGPLPPEVVPL